MRKIGNLIGLAISLAALAWMVTKYDFSEMLPHLRSANYTFFLPIPILLLLNFVLRAARWRLLCAYQNSMALSSFFSAMMIGNLFNNILPARGGEFIKIYLLGRTAFLSKSRILATVVVEKAADLIVAMALLALLLAVYPVPTWARNAGVAVGMVALAGFSFVVVLGIGGTRIATMLGRRLGFLRPVLKARAEAAMLQFVAGLSGLFSIAGTTYFLCYCVAIWVLELAVMSAVARAFAIDLGAADLLFVMLMILFGTMVPSSPGYIGTFEFFGLNALAALGIAGGGALGFVVVFHGTLLLGSSLLGIVCLAVQGWPSVKATPDPEASEVMH